MGMKPLKLIVITKKFLLGLEFSPWKCFYCHIHALRTMHIFLGGVSISCQALLLLYHERTKRRDERAKSLKEAKIGALKD